MIRIVSLPDGLKDIRNSDNLYRFDLTGDEFPYNAFDYYVDMKIVAYGTGENRTILKDNKEYLQHKLDVIKQYIYNHALNFNDEMETDLDVEECKDLVHYIDTDSFDREAEDDTR